MRDSFLMESDGFAFAKPSESLVVLRIGDGTPSDSLWSEYVKTVGEIAKNRTVRIFADGIHGGGRPKPTQRRELSEAADASRVRAAMITDNAVVRGVATVFRWLGYQNEAFSSAHVAEALEYLWCDELEGLAIRRLLPHLDGK